MDGRLWPLVDVLWHAEYSDAAKKSSSGPTYAPGRSSNVRVLHQLTEEQADKWTDGQQSDGRTEMASHRRARKRRNRAKKDFVPSKSRPISTWKLEPPSQERREWKKQISPKVRWTNRKREKES